MAVIYIKSLAVCGFAQQKGIHMDNLEFLNGGCLGLREEKIPVVFVF